MKKKISLLFVSSLLAIGVTGCGNNNQNIADMVVYANQIYTANENGEFAKALAIKDGKFIYVGSEEEAKKYVGSNTTVYTTNFIMPSGIETHAHFLLEQAFMKTCYIKQIGENGISKSKEDILKEIEDYAIENCDPNEENAHLFGYGYMQFPLMGTGYNRLELDNLNGGKFKNVPIYIAEGSLHEAWVNTITLERAGISITADPSNPDPIVGVKREGGVATGVLTNEAVAYVLQKGYRYPILNSIAYQNAVKNTSSFLNSMGYTGHYDAWTNFDGSEELYKALNNVDKDNQLTCFYTASYNIPTYEYTTETLDSTLSKVVGIRNNYKSNHVDPKFVKLFADGVLETGTGYLKEPYVGIYEGSYGEKIWKDEDMDNIVINSNKKDLLVHIHTLGDASCSEAVSSFVKSNNQNGKKYRNSLGHCILISDEDIDLIKQNDIGTAMNVGWLTEQAEGFDLYDYIIGPERAKKMYPIDQLNRKGIKAAICTDRPCADGPIDIFDYLACIVLGYAANDGNQTPRRKIDISVKDAINMLTINGAWMSNYENERGSIEVGKYADFVTSNLSPFDCDAKVINQIEVGSTCFEGKFVYLAK